MTAEPQVSWRFWIECPSRHRIKEQIEKAIFMAGAELKVVTHRRGWFTEYLVAEMTGDEATITQLREQVGVWVRANNAGRR